MIDKKWIHGVIPTILMSTSVGQIYAFTNFTNDIAEYTGGSAKAIQLAFSFGIFFLGMGAAFFGKLVEKNIKLSAIIGSFLFILGLVVTQIGINVSSIPLIQFGYGCLLGLGTGIIYITPVKTMMMWFSDRKALASAFPIIFFGLGSTFATTLYSSFIGFGIEKLFYLFALTYLPMMIIGQILLKKPDVDVRTALGSSNFSYKDLLQEPFFQMSWMFMLLNISAGLSLIPLAKTLMQNLDFSAKQITIYIALSGVFNGAGRLVYAYVADKLNNRANIIFAIAADSVIALLICMIWPNIFGISLLIINACYGAGFSVIPSILSDKFGMSDISKIHGAVLSAWGIAGLIGNNISIRVIENHGFTGVVIMLLIMHIFNLINWYGMKNELSEVKKDGIKG